MLTDVGRLLNAHSSGWHYKFKAEEETSIQKRLSSAYLWDGVG